MSAGMETSRENLTLTDAEFAACKPLAGEGGHVLRALCPFHGSDHQRSLRVTLASGRFVCFACGAWGYLAEARERWRDEQQRLAALRRPPARPQRPLSQRPQQQPAAARPAPREPAPARSDLAQQLAAFQAALPGSRGAAYLCQRGIPLALASQNRSAGNYGNGKGTAALDSLKESGDLEYAADVVLFLTDAPERGATPPARAVELTVAKNRHGETGKLGLIFRPDLGIMREEVRL